MSNIPKIIHQIWFQGEENIPDFHKKYQNICKTMYSDWKYMFWDNTSITDLITENYPNLLFYYNFVFFLKDNRFHNPHLIYFFLLLVL